MMRFFKYLVFLLFCFSSTFAYSEITYSAGGGNYGNSPQFPTKEAACSWFTSRLGETITFFPDSTGEGSCIMKTNAIVAFIRKHGEIICPSAKLIEVRVPVNAQKYQCFSGCQYGITKCVDLNIQEGMACDAISTGIACGGTPPKPPKDPNDNSVTPDAPTDTPSAPGQNPSGTNTNSATSTSTTTNNTTTTITKIDLSSLESTIQSVGKILGQKLDLIKNALDGDGSTGDTDLTETNKKLDEIKENGDDLNDWLDVDDTDGVGDDVFGNDDVPEKKLDKKNFSTSIFGSNAQCPSDKTLSMTLFTGRTFSKTFSYSMWCDKLAIFGQFILIVSYLYGAHIVTRNS